MNESNAGSNMDKKCPECGANLPSGALEGLCPACLLKQGATETATQPRRAPFVAPSVGEVATLFPQLEILSLIGRGGMGAVYKARQPALDRIVALKLLPPESVAGPGFTERFNREARALARLNHPNIVVIHEFGQAGALPYFIMEFVDGLNLRQLEQSGRLPAREALAIIPQICEALQFAHDAGIVHRDVKPENILIDKAGRVKIADFGIAKMMGVNGGEEASVTSHALGTPHYMAPEQVEHPETVDHRADIYSLGVVLYEMLTGELPLGKFAAPSRRVRVDVRLDEVVLRALEKEPDLRYQKVSEVGDRLETIAEGPGGASPPPPPPANPPAAASPGPSPDAAAFAAEILSRKVTLNIGSCLNRGWNLVRANFWMSVGVTIVIMLVTHGAPFLRGPLMGGLWLFYLKRARGQNADFETAFSGFRAPLLQLFIGGVVVLALIGVGFLCLVLPGIYLAAAWLFTLPLIIDQGLDFWPAMELSRKVVNRHWLKFMAFWLLLLLVSAAGYMCLIGMLVTVPIAMAAAAYAYEDIFGPSRKGAPLAPGARGAGWRPGGRLVAAGVAVALIIMLLLLLSSQRRASVARYAAQEAYNAQRAAALQNTPEAATGMDLAFAPVAEVVLEDAAENINNACVKLTGPHVTSLPAAWPGTSDDPAATTNLWISITPAIIAENIDLVARGDRHAVQAFLPGAVRVGNELFDSVTPEDVLHNEELNRQAALDDRAVAGEELSVTNPPATYLFKSRGGASGVMQIAGYIGSPRQVRLRFKVVNAIPGHPKGKSRESAREDLQARLEAAGTIVMMNQKDEVLSGVALEAAKLGETDLAGQALSQIVVLNRRDDSTAQAARLLLKRGMRKQAIELARGITSMHVRDSTMAELAR